MYNAQVAVAERNVLAEAVEAWDRAVVEVIVQAVVAWDPAAEVVATHGRAEAATKAVVAVPVEVAVTKVAVRRAVDLCPVAVKVVEGYRGDDYPLSNTQCPTPKARFEKGGVRHFRRTCTVGALAPLHP